MPETNPLNIINSADSAPLLNALNCHFDKSSLNRVDSMLMNAASIDELETIILHMPQVDIPVHQYIDNGIYVREIFIPKGTFAIGMAHTESFSQVISLGEMLMFSDGGICDHVSAPYTGVGKAGYRKAGYALEDTIWTTFQSCKDETDVVSFFEGSVIKSASAISFENKSKDREDFLSLLNDNGISVEEADKAAFNESDRVDLDLDKHGLKIGISPIHCVGMFADKDFGKGNFIIAGNIDGKRTQGERYVNHSLRYNAKFIVSEKNINLVSIDHIKNGDEITVDYRESLGTRKELPCQEY